MPRRHRLLLAVLLLPMLGGGLAGLRWMHETFAHGLDGGCEVASACGGHRHGLLTSHARTHDHRACGDHDHAPASALDLDADERDSTDREPVPEPGPAHCLSCELLAVMVTGGLELPETPLASPIVHDEPPRIVGVRPLTAPSTSRARPPPAC